VRLIRGDKRVLTTAAEASGGTKRFAKIHKTRIRLLATIPLIYKPLAKGLYYSGESSSLAMLQRPNLILRRTSLFTSSLLFSGASRYGSGCSGMSGLGIHIRDLSILMRNLFSLFLVFRSPLLFKFFSPLVTQASRNSFSRFFSHYVFYGTNLLPDTSFAKVLTKTLVSTRSNSFLKENVTPWAYNNIIRFMEHVSGRRALIQIYSFMNQSMEDDYLILYRR
jgi:hypothetical protein